MTNIIRRRALRRWIAAGAIALGLAACNAKKEPDAVPATKDSAAAVSIPKHPPSQPMEHPQMDTTDGTITVTGTGVTSGTWNLPDVNATLDEVTGGGASQSLMTLEAHDAINGRHLRFRLLRAGGPIDAGTYSMDAAAKGGRTLEVRWEENGKAFRSLDGSHGSLVIRSYQGNRAAGTFDITLPMLDDAKLSETLKGSFNQRVQQ